MTSDCHSPPLASVSPTAQLPSCADSMRAHLSSQGGAGPTRVAASVCPGPQPKRSGTTLQTLRPLEQRGSQRDRGGTVECSTPSGRATLALGGWPREGCWVPLVSVLLSTPNTSDTRFLERTSGAVTPARPLADDPVTYLEVRLSEAPGHGNHGGGQGARDADGGQKLGNVGGEAKRDWTVGVQVSRCVVYVKPEVGDVQFAGVLNVGRGQSVAGTGDAGVSHGEGQPAHATLPERSAASRG